MSARLPYTDKDKLRCIERELSYRQRIYPRRVAAGKMTQLQANREIFVLEDIAADYVAKIHESIRAKIHDDPPLTGQDALDAKWDHDRDARKHE